MMIPISIGIDVVSTGVTLGALYALIAVGLTMVYGMLRILHVAHAAILIVGAYSGFYTWQVTGSFLMAIPVSMAIGGFVNVAIYFALYRWVIEEEPLIPLIASIALFIALSDSFRIIFGSQQISFPVDFSLPSLLPTFTAPQFVVVLLTAVLFVGVYLLVNYTRVGLAWQVSAQDRETAGAMGINVRRITALNFLVGGMLAGVAGVLVGMYYGSISPYMANTWAYKTFIIIVLGGMGSIRGTVGAALLLGLFETIVIAGWGYIFPRDAIAFSLMILVLMFRPEGLFSSDISILEYVQSMTTRNSSSDIGTPGDGGGH